MSTVAVVGAAGIIGPAIVATLAEHEAVQEIRCLDVNADGARAVAEQHGGSVTIGDTVILVHLPATPRPAERLRVIDRPRVHRAG